MKPHDFWTSPAKTRGYPPRLACQWCGGELPLHPVGKYTLLFCSDECANKAPPPPSKDMRYAIAHDDDNGDYLVEDHVRKRLIARTGKLGLDDLQSLVGLANQGESAETTIALADSLAAAATDLEQTLAKLIKIGETEISSTDIAGEAIRDRLNAVVRAIKAYKAART